MEIQKLQGPQSPPPNDTDLASFSALQKYYERVNGFFSSEAELRAQRESTPDGGVGKQHDLPGTVLFMPLMTGTRNTSLFRCLRLSSSQTHTAKESGLTRQRSFGANRSQDLFHRIRSFNWAAREVGENGVPTAHVITLPGANHYVFLSNEAEVLKDIDTFLASLH